MSSRQEEAMRIWRTAAACMIIGAALMIVILHHHSTAGARADGSAHAADGVDSRQWVSPGNAGDGTSSDDEQGLGAISPH
jgi:hypothetical protein